MRLLHRLFAPLLAIALTAGCVSPVPPAAPPASIPDATVPPPIDIATATRYRVDPAASQVDILVYRGGTLAHLGHNHVMTSKAVAGRVWLDPQLDQSGFELSFPVNELIVDDAQARREAGPQFPPDIPQAAKDGTRKNMLRTEVLDGERFAQISLQSVRIGGTQQTPLITARITIKDVSRDIEVPAAVQIDGTRLTASGEFGIQQTDFGIKPFSVAMGALAVKDQLRIKFVVVARKEE